ncbi:Pkinase-domain-containing protein [Mollisia scopiformis]|uniref:Serine/threonine-protein kinase ATG1 n=1 Tax=Mollisia scopiformis TaxID=149040 RepID=A0A194X5W6_MOLSC|nr:Pkinase-domain-containing protein [Mollisia scopiformis]KUJ15469.1 Pkinase-domain-containing protein [Mollisia scopiformis]
MAAHPPPSSSSSPRRSRTGDKVVGSFSIEEEIGKGSFATVYKGTHATTGALVAIKSVNLSKLNKKLKENLYCEIEILKGLHHPHIVALIDCRESPTHIHLVMEYCELGDLSYFIKKRDRLADNAALKDMVRKYPMPPAGGLNEVIVRHFLKQLASAMEFLRERNFIHRDVKPQNLLLLPSPQFLAQSKDRRLVMSASREAMVPIVGLTSLPMLKIADFGFARSLPSTSLAETLCGSPLYMAPEILRYEKYDAKADLWSVGTVLFEMMTGRPPFRANNHVELLRKIEQSEDHIRFPKEAILSPPMKELIKALLKRTPVERLPFENFFRHPVVVDPIPGLVGDDRPAELRVSNKATSDLQRKQTRAESKSADQDMERIPSSGSGRRVAAQTDSPIYSSSPRSKPVPSSPRPRSTVPVQQVGTPPQPVVRPASREKRPTIPSSATAPNAETIQANRPKEPRRTSSRKSSIDEGQVRKSSESTQSREAIEEAEQAVRDAREYVLVEKRAVEVNAFADEMAANPRLQGTKQQPVPTRTGQISRRATTQGYPASATGAVPASPSRAVQIAQGKPRSDVVPQRQNSFGKSYGSPSATSAIAKALHGASVRVFGVGWSPHLIGKGVSPPQLYSPFPAYPTPVGLGLIGDSRPAGPVDEDQKAVNYIEESATRSDVVYGFAEVKYKQLIPMAPSMDHGLGGPAADKSGGSIQDDEGLTTEAIVALSEEALVLYVKALSLLAKSMDIAGGWWARKSRGEVLPGGQIRAESASSVSAGNRINSAVQWVRNRFNEVLEKAEVVRLKLLDAQKKLPEDHPGHPSNHTSASRIAGASSTDGVVLSSGITAEKLMYDRALEMSRSAAINEIANEDLPGCEISYITAIRMLEAVLENDDDSVPHRRRSSSLREEKVTKEENDGTVNGIYLEDRQAVLKVVSMIRTRLSTLRKKMALIAKHQSLPPSSPRPSSITHHSSGGTTPTVANTPPH